MEGIPIIPSETLSERIGKLVQEQRVAMLDPGYKTAVVWPEPPDDEHVHIIVGLPSGAPCYFVYCNLSRVFGLDHAASRLQRYESINAPTHDLWPAVTMHAIARGNFGGWASLEKNMIVDHTGSKPDFLEQFISKLRQRWNKSDTVCFINHIPLVIENRHRTLWLCFLKINLTSLATTFKTHPQATGKATAYCRML